jgi:Uma2 family endonuclease
MALPVKTAGITRLYTTDEFMALALDDQYRYELVRGEIQRMAHPGEAHMLIASNLHVSLGSYVLTKKLGRVLSPGSYVLKIPNATTDTVRSPDLAYLAKEKITGQSGAVQIAPDLAVEIYSPTDRPGILKEKLEDYQAAGWDLVWVIYPASAPRKKQNTVEIYRLQQSPNPIQTLSINDTLEGAEIISGFKMPVAQLFDF